jgi:regulator of protease activity HflC (stomatin/prohibitin superfamily)
MWAGGILNAGSRAGAVPGPGEPSSHPGGDGMAGLFGFKIISQYERGVVFRWGRVLPGIREPGLTWVNPFTDRLRKVNMQIAVVAVPGQETITRDNVTMRVDAVVYYRVVDPVKAIVNVQDYRFAVAQVAATSLRAVTGRSDMDQIMELDAAAFGLGRPTWRRWSHGSTCARTRRLS